MFSDLKEEIVRININYLKMREVRVGSCRKSRLDAQLLAGRHPCACVESPPSVTFNSRFSLNQSHCYFSPRYCTIIT